MSEEQGGRHARGQLLQQHCMHPFLTVACINPPGRSQSSVNTYQLRALFFHRCSSSDSRGRGELVNFQPPQPQRLSSLGVSYGVKAPTISRGDQGACVWTHTWRRGSLSGGPGAEPLKSAAHGSLSRPSTSDGGGGVALRLPVGS